MADENRTSEGRPPPIIISGWACWIFPSGIRGASPRGKGLVDLMSYSEHGLTVSGVSGTLQAPPAVLAWLTKPLLEQQWTAGYNAGYADAHNDDETENPHKEAQ